MTPEPYFDGSKWWYSERSWRHGSRRRSELRESDARRNSLDCVRSRSMSSSRG